MADAVIHYSISWLVMSFPAPSFGPQCPVGLESRSNLLAVWYLHISIYARYKPHTLK